MPKGIVIWADMKAPPEFRDFDTLEDFETVAGSPLKVVPIPQLGVAVVANAEGNRRGLPVNTHATLLWWFWALALRREVVLLGDVVIVGEPDPDGQPTNVPAQTNWCSSVLPALLLTPRTSCAPFTRSASRSTSRASRCTTRGTPPPRC